MSISLDLDETERPETSGRRTGRSFYAAPVSEFRITDDDAIIGRLSSRHVAFHAAAEAEQLRAWQRVIEILKESFAKPGSLCDDWQLLLEIPLLRLGKRIDAVVLAHGVVGVIEFKINATCFQSAVVDTSISGRRVARELTALIARRGGPGLIVSDQGAEFTSNAMLARGEKTGVPWHFIALGKPMQNCTCEALNSKMQDELLKETLFTGLDHARSVIGAWVADCNATRPPSTLGCQTPAAYAAQLAAMGHGLQEKWATGSKKTEAFRRSPIAPSGQADNCYASALVSAG